MKYCVSHKYAKNVSGYFFFSNLAHALSLSRFYDVNAKTILANVSVPLLEMIRLKFSGHKIVLRLDGAYHDKIDYLEITDHTIFNFLGGVFPNSTSLNWLFNFLFENWKVEIRIAISSAIIYQSEFSLMQHKTFLLARFKRSQIISNAYPQIDKPQKLNRIPRSKALLVMGRNKRKNDKIALIHALRYCDERDIPLKVVNWQESNYADFDSDTQKKIKLCGVELLDKFNDLNDLYNISIDCKFFIFLSYRDPCPNILLETISLGLLPVTVASGGIPEILPKNYPLLKLNDQFGFYSPSRYSERLPEINYGSFASTFKTIESMPHTSTHLEKLELQNVRQLYEDFLLEVTNERR